MHQLQIMLNVATGIRDIFTLTLMCIRTEPGFFIILRVTISGHNPPGPHVRDSWRLGLDREYWSKCYSCCHNVVMMVLSYPFGV